MLNCGWPPRWSTVAIDVALLALKAASKIPDDRTYYQVGITTRTPRDGEMLHLVGFRPARVEAERALQITDHIYASSGKVLRVMTARDRVLQPNPCIELDCDSLGAMSGGAVLDRNGLLVGIISTGLSSADGNGVTYAAWLWTAMGRQIKLEWPNGIYNEPVSILSMNKRLVFIDRRDTINANRNEVNFTLWFE